MSVLREGRCAPWAAHGGRSAVLIDLENLLWDRSRVDAARELYGDDEDALRAALPHPWVEQRRARRILSESRAAAADAVGGPADYWLAVASAGLIAHVSGMLLSSGIDARIVETTPDAADAYLLDQGEHLEKVGFTDFVVVSGDHAFAEFVARHSADVVVRDRASLSKELRAAAGRVHILEHLAPVLQA